MGHPYVITSTDVAEQWETNRQLLPAIRHDETFKAAMLQRQEARKRCVSSRDFIRKVEEKIGTWLAAGKRPPLNQKFSIIHEIATSSNLTWEARREAVEDALWSYNLLGHD